MPAILVFADNDRLGHPLKQREVDVDIQGLCFEAVKAVRHDGELLTQTVQIFQPLVEAEVLHAVYANLHPQEGAELLVHAAHQILTVDAEYMVAVVQLVQDAVQFAAQSAVDAHSEDQGDLVSGQAQESQFAGALENLVNGEVPVENEVPTVLDLINRVAATKMDGPSILFRELGTQQPSPVIQPLFDDRRAQLIGSDLQRLRV